MDYLMFQSFATAATDPDLAARELALGRIVLGGLLVFMVLNIISHISAFFIFRKAGRKGRWVFVPIYNLWCAFEVADYPGYYSLLSYLPLVGTAALMLVALRVARAFDKSVIFAVGLVLLPFVALPMLAFGKAVYKPSRMHAD
jgi:hypothetical protein